MRPRGRARRLPAIPIWAQIVSLLIGSLMVAQFTPLVLALLMPPPPPPQYRLIHIAAALKGGPLAQPHAPALQRAYTPNPPAAHSFGWVEAEGARRELARLLDADPANVRLLFYSPPPFLGGPRMFRHHPHPLGGRRLRFEGAPDGPLDSGGWRSRDHWPITDEGPPVQTAAPASRSSPPRTPATAHPPAASTEKPAPEDAVAVPLGAPQAPHPLFGLMRPPSVDGEFVAALKVGPESWALVRPVHGAWLNPWQRRMALWFLLAFGVTAPVGYLFARRLTAPLARLAEAADRLGRDPSATIPPASGSVEIDRVSRAFEGMQARVRRYVDDRTAMVGAISHDLRTPLARMRFRLEKAPEALRLQMLGDIGQMEEMIAAVLAFIRDASEPGVRERVDLRSIVECVIDDAALVGGDATLEPGDPLAVEVDILSVQRLVTNLVENALKYGGRAAAALSYEGDEAIVEILDDGPGLSDPELARVFQPFYRSGEARNLDANGIGLGLSVARSIARAHGGDVVLRRRTGAPGLLAQVRLPLARAPTPSANPGARPAGIGAARPPVHARPALPVGDRADIRA